MGFSLVYIWGGCADLEREEVDFEVERNDWRCGPWDRFGGGESNEDSGSSCAHIRCMMAAI